MYTYHVTCGVNKKVVSIDSQDQATVCSAISSAFLMESGVEFALQLWDNDFSDWVDAPDSELPDKSKLNVLVKGQILWFIFVCIFNLSHNADLTV